MFISDSPFDSFVGERGSRLDLFDAVDWLQELDHELVEAHAEHRRRLFELLGIECSFASQSFADGFLAHAEFLGERGLCLAVPCELAAEFLAMVSVSLICLAAPFFVHCLAVILTVLN